MKIFHPDCQNLQERSIDIAKVRKPGLYRVTQVTGDYQNSEAAIKVGSQIVVLGYKTCSFIPTAIICEQDAYSLPRSPTTGTYYVQFVSDVDITVTKILDSQK